MLNQAFSSVPVLDPKVVMGLVAEQRRLNASDIELAMAQMTPVVRRYNKLYYVKVPDGGVWPRLDANVRLDRRTEGLVEYRRKLSLHVPVLRNVFDPDPIEVLHVIQKGELHRVFGFEIVDARSLDPGGRLAPGLHVGRVILYSKW